MGRHTFQHISLIYLLFSNILHEALQENATETTFQVHIFSSITLPCPGDSQTGKRWEHRGEVLYARRANIGNLPDDSVQLTQNYSLVVSNASFAHEGSYDCIRDSKVWKYFLYITVMPRLSLTINGQDYLSGQFSFFPGDTVVAECNAQDSRPEVKLTWMVNNRVLLSYNGFSDYSSNFDNKTFDVTSSLTLVLGDTENGNITCVVSYNTSRYPDEHLSVNYSILERNNKFSLTTIIVCSAAMCGLIVMALLVAGIRRKGYFLCPMSIFGSCFSSSEQKAIDGESHMKTTVENEKDSTSQSPGTLASRSQLPIATEECYSRTLNFTTAMEWSESKSCDDNSFTNFGKPPDVSHNVPCDVQDFNRNAYEFPNATETEYPAPDDNSMYYYSAT